MSYVVLSDVLSQTLSVCEAQQLQVSVLVVCMLGIDNVATLAGSAGSASPEVQNAILLLGQYSKSSAETDGSAKWSDPSPEISERAL